MVHQYLSPMRLLFVISCILLSMFSFSSPLNANTHETTRIVGVMTRAPASHHYIDENCIKLSCCFVCHAIYAMPPQNLTSRRANIIKPERYPNAKPMWFSEPFERPPKKQTLKFNCN